MDTALYYTFSTVSQTLAGAIAFLGAFVLYRLQIQRQRLKAIGERVTWSCTIFPQSALKNYLELEQYDKFLEYCRGIMSKLPLNAPNDPEQFYFEFQKFEWEMGLKERLFPKLKTALLFTIGVIVYSVLVLIFTPWITSCKIAAYIVITTTGIIGLSICLWCYFQLIMQTIFDEG